MNAWAMHNDAMHIFPLIRRGSAWFLASVLLGSVALLIADVDDASAQQQPTQGERGWLGIVMAEKPGGNVVVEDIVRGSPAASARMRPGDTVLRVDGVAVQSAKDMSRIIGDSGVGSVVSITVLREGVEQTLRATLVRAPSNAQLQSMALLNRPAPAFRSLATTDGAISPTLESFRGKVVVIDFWASYCRACGFSAPSLNAMAQRYASRGLEVIGIAAESPTTVARGVERFGMRYASFADPNGTTTGAYFVRELPTFVVIDRKGVVREIASSFDSTRMRQMEATIDRLLAEPAPVPAPAR